MWFNDNSNTCHLSFLMMSWGMISDVDIESERFRSLGIFRNTIYSLLCIMRLRRYPGRLSFLPVRDKRLSTLCDLS